jgi:hypothetical protein
MAFTKLIQDQVKSAFSIIGDLATEVTLTTAAGTNYSFDTGAVTSTTSNKTVKAIIEESIRRANPQDFGVVTKIVYIQRIDLPDPTSYDTVTIGTKVHKIVQSLKDVALVTLTVTEV